MARSLAAGSIREVSMSEKESDRDSLRDLRERVRA